jgi:hypothetical protein
MPRRVVPPKDGWDDGSLASIYCVNEVPGAPGASSMSGTRKPSWQEGQ